jgi:ATP-dependent exoDNAse (exonuclease V) beta subunit
MTPDQERAVTTLAGDVAIRAGAGSGKTMVLAHRFAAALEADRIAGWEPAAVDEILAITFSRKAAGEVVERVRRVVSERCGAEVARAVDDAWISTIHTFCGRLIRRHILESGVDPAFTQMDEVQSAAAAATAFERAAGALFGTDPSVTELMLTTGLDELKSRVLDCHDNARALGLDPELLVVDVGADLLEGLVGEALDIARAIDEVLAEQNQTEAVTRNRALIAAWCEAVTTCRLDADDGHAQLAVIVESWEASHMRGVADLKAELDARLEEVGQAAMFACRADLAAGFERLARSHAREYRGLKQAAGVLDFEGLQERAVALLRTRPAIANRLRDHFRLIMVDEFQDTNDLQMAVLAPLRADNLCVVGDDRQAIYGWRYADVRIFDALRRAASTSIELAKNFRSHPDILAFVNSVFTRPHLFGADFMSLSARDDISAFLPTEAGEPRIEVMCVDSDARIRDRRVLEARAVAQRVAELVEVRGVTPGDIALLVRASTDADIYAHELERAGISAFVSAGAALFDEPEVKELMAMLRAIAVPTDDRALAEVLGGRWVGLSDAAMSELRRIAGRTPLWHGLNDAAEGAGDFDERDRALVGHTHAVFEHVGASLGESTLPEVIHELVEAFDYDLTLFAHGASGVRELANVEKVVRLARDYGSAHTHDPAGFVSHLHELATHAREQVAPVDDGSGAVTIMTVHGSKGLEFPVVFAVNLTGPQCGRGAPAYVAAARDGSGRPAAALRLSTSGGMRSAAHVFAKRDSKQARTEEEKRALYVALTRAESRLYVSGATSVGKPASEGRTLIDWVREAIGDPPGSGDLDLGGAAVRFTVITDEDEASDDALDRVEEADARPRREGFALPEWSPAAEPRLEVRPQSVSFSALWLHHRCALSYHASHTLGLAAFSPEESAALGFGTAVHELLECIRVGEAFEAAVERVSARAALGPRDRRRLTEAAEGFLGSAAVVEAFAGESVRAEEPLRMALGDTVLRGSIDLISWSGDRALIVDYKTGAEPGDDAEKRAAYELQAKCYALAACADGADAVRVVFVFGEHPGVEMEFAFAKADEPEIRSGLEERVNAIKTHEWTHLEAYEGGLCDTCPAFEMVCPVRRPRSGR